MIPSKVEVPDTVVREVPEAMKPRIIEITTKTTEQPKVLDSQAAA